MAFHTAFLVALTFGTLAMVVLREAIPNPLAGAACATAACALIIVAFARIFFRRSRTEAVRGADNFYYLGLLFTLVSLIYVLVRVFGLDGGGEDRTQQIIGNFGIALGSTVVGIVVRIVLLGLDPGHEEAPRRRPWRRSDASGWEPPWATGAPIAIDPDLAALRDQLRQATDAFSHFTRMTQAQADRAKAHAERVMHEFNQRVDAMAEARLRSLDTVEAAWAEGTERVRDQHEAMIADAEDKLTTAIERSSDAWSELARQAVEGSRHADRRAQATSERIAEILENVAAVTRALGPFAAGIGAVSRSVTTLDGAANEATARLGALSRSSQNAASEIGTARRTAAGQLTELHRALSTTREAIATLDQLLATTSNGVRLAGEAGDKAQTRLGEATESIGGELGKAGGAIVTAIGSVASAGKAFDSSTASLVRLQDVVDNLRRTATHEPVNAAVAELADAVRTYHEELRGQIGPWSQAIDALNDLIAEQRNLVEKNAAIATGLLEPPRRRARPRLLGWVWPRRDRATIARP